MKSCSDKKDYGFVILHIPHSSLHIPESYRNTILLNDKQLYREMQRMTDIFCDELYDAPEFTNRLIAPVSRFVCDMERFRDDRFEICAKKGQGLMYTKTSDGKRLRKYNVTLRNQILAEWYDPHHKKLTAMVEEALEKYGKCLVIDCHSFPQKTSIPSKIIKPLAYADFDIGTDGYHTPAPLCDLLCEKVREFGHTVKVNKPFAGAITPMKFYGKDKRVFSVMIETNRKLYERERNMKKSYGFAKTKDICHALMRCAADFVEVL